MISWMIRVGIGVLLISSGTLLLIKLTWGFGNIPDVDPTRLPHQARDLLELRRAMVFKHPDSADTWGEYGRFLMAHDLLPEARICFEKAESLPPKNSVWPYLLGVMLSISDPAEAREAFVRAIEIDPYIPVMHLRLGELLIELDQIEEARQYFEKAEPLVKTQKLLFARTKLGLARIELIQGNAKQALILAEEANQNSLNQRVILEVLSRASYQLGDRERSERYLLKAKSVPERSVWPDPDVQMVLETRRDADWEAGIALQNYQNGEKNAGLHRMEELVAEHPNRPEFAIELARMQVHIMDNETALRTIARAMLLVPNSPDLWYFRGDLQTRANKPTALADFQKVVELKPDHALGWQGIGKCLEKKDPAKAKAAYLKSIEIDPTLIDSHVALVQIFLDEQNYAQARTYFDVVERHDPYHHKIREWKPKFTDRP